MLGVKSTNVPIKGDFAVRFCEQLQKAVSIREDKLAKGCNLASK